MPWGEISQKVEDHIVSGGLVFSQAIEAVADELDLAFTECLQRFIQEQDQQPEGDSDQ